MKKFNLSLVAVLAMSTFAIAGGDIAPVEPVIETPMVEESTPGNFYLGLAYGMANIDGTDTWTPAGSTVSQVFSDDTDYSTVMLQAGYKFNPYIALEGRYWVGMDEDLAGGDTLNIDTWGIYAKPMYPVTDAFDIYALLGYASSDAEVTDTLGNTFTPSYDIDGFSWGIGAGYAFTENVSVFIDYTSMYDDENTVTDAFGKDVYEDTITAVNFGVTYTF
jgi:opacity protein-like surface antigen